MDVEEEAILRAALELVFEDDPTPRMQGNKDEGGGVCERMMECWVRVYMTQTGRCWDSYVSKSSVVGVAVIEVLMNPEKRDRYVFAVTEELVKCRMLWRY